MLHSRPACPPNHRTTQEQTDPRYQPTQPCPYLRYWQSDRSSIVEDSRYYSSLPSHLRMMPLRDCRGLRQPASQSGYWIGEDTFPVREFYPPYPRSSHFGQAHIRWCHNGNFSSSPLSQCQYHRKLRHWQDARFADLHSACRSGADCAIHIQTSIRVDRTPNLPRGSTVPSWKCCLLMIRYQLVANRSKAGFDDNE